ncbi:CorA family divalent cation transporter [Nonomuraea sp. NPDC003707]
MSPGITEAVRLVRQGHRNAFVWVALADAEDPEVEWLSEVFDVPVPLVRDRWWALKRPRVEEYGDALLVAARSTHYDTAEDGRLIDTGELKLLVGPDYILSLEHSPHGCLAAVRKALERRPHQVALGPYSVVHAILEHLIQQYREAIHLMLVELENVESTLYSSSENDDTDRAYLLRREFSVLRQAVVPFEAPLRLLPQRFLVPPEFREGLRDLGDDLSRVTAEINAGFQQIHVLLGEVRDQQSLALNRQVRKMTAAAALLGVPGLVAAVYGMNLMNVHEVHWALGAPLALAVTVIPCLFLLRWFRRN